MSNNEPIYITIKHDIQNQIFTGKLKPGTKIPSIRDYAINSKINMNTVSNAFSKLDEEGLTIIKRGEGRFVTEDLDIINKTYIERRDYLVNDFITNMKELGYSENEIKDAVAEVLCQD